MEHAYRKVMALADGELSPAELPDLIQVLARNPSLVRAFQVFITVGRQRIAQVYATLEEEPVPQHLIDTIMQAPMGERASRSAKILSYGGALVERLRNKYRVPGWSLAGPAFAAVLAAASAWLLLPAASNSETLLAAQLQRAFETTEAGPVSALFTFQPKVTFLTTDQEYCRQFEVKSPVEVSDVVACRARSGGWRIVLQTPPMPVDGIVPATGDEELRRYVTSRMIGPVLEPEQVRELINNRWRPGATKK